MWYRYRYQIFCMHVQHFWRMITGTGTYRYVDSCEVWFIFWEANLPTSLRVRLLARRYVELSYVLYVRGVQSQSHTNAVLFCMLFRLANDLERSVDSTVLYVPPPEKRKSSLLLFTYAYGSSKKIRGAIVVYSHKAKRNWKLKRRHHEKTILLCLW